MTFDDIDFDSVNADLHAFSDIAANTRVVIDLLRNRVEELEEQVDAQLPKLPPYFAPGTTVYAKSNNGDVTCGKVIAAHVVFENSSVVRTKYTLRVQHEVHSRGDTDVWGHYVYATPSEAFGTSK